MSKTNPRMSMRLKRKRRIRKNLSGSTERPRLSVFRSAKHIYAQIIDDLQGTTLVAAGTLSPEIRDKLGGSRRRTRPGKWANFWPTRPRPRASSGWSLIATAFSITAG